MNRRFPRPRLLPLTIAGMALLLLVKSAVLVRAAVPDSGAAAAPPAGAAPVAASPPAASPAAVSPAARPAAPAPGAPPAASPAALAAPAGCAAPAVSDDERKLLLDLRHRSAELDARAGSLTAREGVLAAAEKRLGQRVAELTSLQQRLESLNTQRKAREESDWRGLVKLYETMKPRDAALIFNDLDRDVLLQVLDRMNERKAAPVLAAMLPERAREVTAELARLREGHNRVAAPQAAGG